MREDRVAVHRDADLAVMAADQPMGFFITSQGPGDGGNLGGLAGADAHCARLAATAGSSGRTWRAYLSTQGSELDDPNVVHARDRIGSGPWYNAKGVMIAKSVMARCFAISDKRQRL